LNNNENLIKLTDLIEDLLESGDINLCEEILINKKCPDFILEKVSNCGNVRKLAAICKNINCPIHILEKLVTVDDSLYLDIIKNSIACNEKTPIHLLESLSNHDCSSVRSAVVTNPICPIHILKKLSDDYEVYVQIAVAKNCKSIDILEKLSKSDKYPVKKAVIGNIYCTFNILKNIYRDDEKCRKYIINHPNWKLNEFN